MKTLDLDLRSLIIGVLLTLLIVAVVLIATTANTPRAWEYKNVSTVNIQIPPEVTKLGEEGWEVVGYTHWKHPSGQGNDYNYFVLKRAKGASWNWKFWK